MRSRTRRYRPIGDIRLNLTALVDVTVLLLTFFMVVNQFATAERVEMEVPKPAESVARDRRLPENVVINVLYRGPDAPATYQFGAIPVDTLEALSARLAAARRLAPHMEVVLRADRRLPYEDVRAVMQLLGEHEISHFQLVAEVESLP